ncbi:ABC transporter ATP-binding protein [Mycena kentingensis (nom. inval.)]|nr:ABC transporter ATP-binding protein [Mycena kentingensis (nom. inval.)]
MLRLRPTRLLRPLTRRYAQAPTETPNSDAQREWRRPWLYKVVGMGHFIVIPIVCAYAVFWWDWEDEKRGNHVFMAPRRWLQRQKEAFFSLSPAEKQLANLEDTEPTPAPSVAPVESSKPSGILGFFGISLPSSFFKPYFRVKHLRVDGPAATAGLREDDLVVTFANVPVRDLPPKQYMGMLFEAAQNNNPIPIVVIRQGQEVTLLLTPAAGDFGCELERWEPGQVER